MCIHDSFYDSARSALLQPLNFLSRRYSISRRSIPLSTPSPTSSVSSSSDSSMDIEGLSSITEDLPSTAARRRSSWPCLERCILTWFGTGRRSWYCSESGKVWKRWRGFNQRSQDLQQTPKTRYQWGSSSNWTLQWCRWSSAHPCHHICWRGDQWC